MDGRERTDASRAATSLARGVAGWLVAALGEEEGRRTLEDAYRLAGASGAITTPEQGVELVRGPVARALARLFGARLAALLLRSLQAELLAIGEDATALGSDPHLRAIREGALPPSPPRRASTQRLRRKRPVVGLLVTDHLGRSVVARTLVQGECDVRPIDDEDDLPVDTDVVVADLGAEGVERTLRAIVARYPTLPILVWTSLPLSDATALAHRIGARRRLAIGRDVHGRDLLDLVHTLAATLPPTRRGVRA